MSCFHWKQKGDGNSCSICSQETRNNQQKWGILKQVFRGDVTKHGTTFRVCAIITQLAIESGEALFQVDYEDPDVDNLYFVDENEDDDDE